VGQAVTHRKHFAHLAAAFREDEVALGAAVSKAAVSKAAISKAAISKAATSAAFRVAATLEAATKADSAVAVADAVGLAEAVVAEADEAAAETSGWSNEMPPIRLKRPTPLWTELVPIVLLARSPKPIGLPHVRFGFFAFAKRGIGLG
jgi:hypothetical protein